MNDKKFYTGLVSLIVLLMVYIIYTFGIQTTEVLPAKRSPEQLSVWAPSLYNAYHVNFRQADELYRDKRVVVHGNLSHVQDTNQLITLVFIFQKQAYGEQGVKCVLNKRYNALSKDLKTGQEVNVSGICHGLMDDFVLLSDAHLLK